MQNSITNLLTVDDDLDRKDASNLTCSLSLGHVDYFNFYLEQRVAEHVLKSERSSCESKTGNGTLVRDPLLPSRH